jgi:hypothetical protein
MSSNYTYSGDDDEPDDDLYAEYEEDDPNNPRHRDHDLSDSAMYDWDRPADVKPWYLQRWFMMTIGILLVFSLLLPMFVRVS